MPTNHSCTISSPILPPRSISRPFTHSLHFHPTSYPHIHQPTTHPMTTPSSFHPSFHSLIHWPITDHSLHLHPSFHPFIHQPTTKQITTSFSLCSTIGPPLICTHIFIFYPVLTTVSQNQSFTHYTFTYPSIQSSMSQTLTTPSHIHSYLHHPIQQPITHSLTILSSIIPSSHPSANHTHLH